LQKGEKTASDSPVARLRPDIGVPEQGNVLYILDSHDPGQVSHLFIPVKKNTRRDLVPEFLTRHIRFMPPVIGNDAFIGTSCVINDFINAVKIFFRAAPDHNPPYRSFLEYIRSAGNYNLIMPAGGCVKLQNNLFEVFDQSVKPLKNKF
jgi:hypothetical protein